jgi:HD-GYP domain-containing protein (c-di-GMP phosphodiesterase class II)
MVNMTRKQRARFAKRYHQILSAVHMVYRLVNSTYNLKELSLRLTRLLCQFIRAQSASLYLLDPENKNIMLIAMFNNKINILLDKREDLTQVSRKERRVTEGYAIFERRLIGLPMVADDNVGAIFIRRSSSAPPFSGFDRDMLSVFVEQSVTAIKNLQLVEQQQKTILGSIQFISKVLERKGVPRSPHTPVYFNIVKALAEKVNVGQEGIKCLYYASVLHAAGALDVPYEILTKRSQLKPEELRLVQELPLRSVELIRPMEFLRPVLPLILSHHEKYDGTGYPLKLKKEQIPLGARIMAVADAFEAMIHGRPYKQRLTVAEAMQELKANSGSQFDPKIVKAFCDLYLQKKFRNYLLKMK